MVATRTLAFSIAALSLLSSSADAFLAPARFGSAPSVVLGQMQRRGVSASPARLARGVLLGVRGAACAQGWDKASYEKGLKSLSEEDEYAYDLDPSSVEGVVPLDVAGTLYTGGPGLFEFGKNKLESQKDGDGFVSAWTFAGDGSCKMRGRFVRTEGFLKEQKALKLGYEGPPIFKSRLGPAPVLGQAAGLYQIDDVKPNANSGVAHFAGRLIAIDDCFLPHELEPAGLYTIGATRVLESLPKRGPMSIPKYDPAEKRLVALSSKTLARPSYTTRTWLLEYGEDWKVVNKREESFKDYHRFTDFAFTRTHFVLAEAPMTVNWVSYAAGGKTVSECVSYDRGGSSKIYLMPRKGGPTVVIDGPADVTERIVNAYQDKEGNVVMDAISMAQLPTYECRNPDKQPATQLVRWVMKADASSTATRKELSSECLDHPTINPFVRSVRHSHIFSSLKVGGAPRGIHSIDVSLGKEDKWIADEGQFPAPPSYMPRLDGESEDDGYLASVVFDSKTERSFLALLDAQKVSSGPVCKIWLNCHIPHGSLGNWADGVVPTQQDYAEGRRKALWSDKGWDAFDGGLPFL